MHIRPLFAVLLLTTLVILTSLTGCGGKPAPAPRPAKPLIVVTVHPVASLVEQLARGVCDVECLIPPGTNPHGFVPSAEQLAAIGRADSLVVVGLGLDDWAVKAAEASGNKKLMVYSFAQLVEREPSATTSPATTRGTGPDATFSPPGTPGSRPGTRIHTVAQANPHLWMEILLTTHFLHRLKDSLAQRYTSHDMALDSSMRSLVVELGELDEEYWQKLTSVRTRRLVTFHNGLDMLARNYGLEVVAHLTDIDATPEGTVTAGQIDGAVEAVNRFALTVIYAEPQFPRTAVDAVQRRTAQTVPPGVRVLTLDADGAASAPSYQQMMRDNLKALLEGQNQAPAGG